MITVLERLNHDPHWNINVLAKCFCGKVWVVRLKSLNNGNTTSCGCLRNTKRGDSQSPECNSWRKMLDRCENSVNPAYIQYGGRGIRVCQAWHYYPNFREDMGRKPTKRHSLDRINNDGNYDPSNCRWATSKEQANNRRHRRWWRKPNV